MHPAVTGELLRARHDDLLREAVRARRAAAARRSLDPRPTRWRRRAGRALVRLGEAVAGPPPCPSAALPSTRRAAS